MYKKVSTDMNFVAREKATAQFWRDNQVMEKSFHHRDGCPKFTFYDGPPTANGRPHIGHIITRAMKDLFPRYQSMKGKDVLRKAGWDTHGLPVELEVEKLLGLDGKPAIEAYGIEPFIHKCKESVWKYLKDWEDISEKVAFWADMKDPYVTYHDDYIESVWWSLKQADNKGLIYRGHKVVPYCPRCGTALSSHEVAQGYEEVTEPSLTVRFKVKGQDDLYLLAWTTTPWTLPSNVALTVNAKETYAEVKLDGTRYILAEALIGNHFTQEERERLETLRTMPGAALVGTDYEPLYSFEPVRERGWYVVADPYVTLTDGTGIVHCAPAFGEDDARVANDNSLPFVQVVNTEGRFADMTPWAGVFIKDADPLITEELKERGLLHGVVDYTHNYPFCWRCDTPLIYYARGTWFIRMTAVKELLSDNNQSVNWMPDNIKDGRMGNFIDNLVDWALSRERYWGTPLPIWLCEDGHRHVVGSKQELYDMAADPFELPELHRPYIDQVVLTCPDCGKPMHRVKEVIDCWYDSGSMPFAQWHYPFENKEKFESRFPADFICEAVDQTRGWFYSLLAISTFAFEKASFKNCLVLGHVQDKDGRKMSKHLGNVVDPWQILDKTGADAVRWYFYTAGAPWLPSRFHEDLVLEGQRKFMGTLWNTYAFYILYADIDRFVPGEHPLDQVELTLMDRWILSRLNSTIKLVDEALASYKVFDPAHALMDFVDELSNWYVRRCRSRFWGQGMAKDKEAAFATLAEVLTKLTRLIAPFLPFISEEMYQNLVRSVDPDAPLSVHLCDFPVVDEARIDLDSEKRMSELLQVVQLGRAARNLANLKVRQPLSRAYVSGASCTEDYAALAEDELNVKELVMVTDPKDLSGFSLKPQLRTLGPRYGKLLGKISAYLKETDGTAAVRGFDKGENLVFTLEGTEVSLSRDDVLIETVQKPGLVAMEERGVTVALDSNLTPELVEEGYARELVSKIQTMRKDAGFEVTDRIHVRFEAGEVLSAVVSAQGGFISQLVLAQSIEKSAAPDGAFSQTWDINGQEAVLSLYKA